MFILAVMLVLAPVVYFVPEEGYDLGGAKIHFLSKEEFFHPKKQVKRVFSPFKRLISQ